MELINRKARFEYHIESTLIAGIVLVGTEVKSIREGKVSFNDSYCQFHLEELFVKNLHIAEYSSGNQSNHIPLQERKLLLNKKEIKKLTLKLREKGHSIVPLRIFFNEKGLAKMEIGLGKGKKQFDKRNTIKEREANREVKRKFGI